MWQNSRSKVREMYRAGHCIGDIALAVKWPKHKSLKQLYLWTRDIPRRAKGIEPGEPVIRARVGTWA